MAITTRLFGLGLGALLLIGCEADGPYLQSDYFEIKPGEYEETYIGGGCMKIDAGSAFGDNPTAVGEYGDPVLYKDKYELEDGGVTFEVRDGAGALLEERFYSEDFVEQGRRDEVAVTLQNGHQLRYVHRGTEDCAIGNEPTKP